MEGNATNFNDAVVLVSASAAVSAFFAGLDFLSSRRLSTREIFDILKAEILRVVSIVHDREEWIATGMFSQCTEGDGIGPNVRHFAGFLGATYKQKREAGYTYSSCYRGAQTERLWKIIGKVKLQLKAPLPTC